MYNIENANDLWPQQGEWLRYIWPDSTPQFGDYFEVPSLTYNNEYQVICMRFITCADQVELQDDEGRIFFIPLYKFSFGDQREAYNK